MKQIKRKNRQTEVCAPATHVGVDLDRQADQIPLKTSEMNVRSMALRRDALESAEVRLVLVALHFLGVEPGDTARSDNVVEIMVLGANVIQQSTLGVAKIG